MKTILYVDDDEMLLKAVRRQLISQGFRVLTTDSLLVASSMLAEADFALLDWQPMGPAMVKACEAAGVPFAIYTGGDIYAVKCDAKFCHIIEKPQTANELVRGIEFAMSVHESMRQK